MDILSDDDAIEALALELARAEAHCRDRAGTAGVVDAPSSSAWAISVDAAPPRILESRARRTLEARVTNRGTAAWPADTMLYSRWARPGSETVFFDGAATLGRELHAGAEVTIPLEIGAPLAPGPWSLSLQIVHAGDWKRGTVRTALQAPVLILPGPAVWTYLRDTLPGPSDWSLAIRRLIGRTA